LIGQSNLTGALLRLSSIAAKFALTLYLARYLSTAELGVYGLVTATTAIGMQLVGLEFHNHATREVVRGSREQRAAIVAVQLRIYALSYLVAMAVVAIAAGFGWISRSIALWLLLLILGNHLSQEAHRLLIALSRPRAAYVTQTIGQGAWVFPAIVLGLISPRFRTLDVIFGSWFVFLLLSLLVSALFLRVEGVFARTAVTANMDSIKRGLAVGGLYLVSSVSFQLIDYSGRYFLSAARGTAQAGVYTLYSSIAGALRELVFAGLVTIAIPSMISAAQSDDGATLRRLGASLQRRCLLWTALALPPFAIIGYVAGRLSGRAEIVRGWGAYLVLLVATLVVSSSMGAHYTLYARRADRSLMYIQLGSAVLCIVMQSILAPAWGANGAAIATLVSVAAMAFAKYWMASRGTFVARQPEHSA
ncbi:MAG TPA: polysaccharide biosynthesis C-terminal domain-containing protein, partial [Polyangiales bacterium]|nr:polysaccharide biosynthesis C-terminal domain-containing protein [Polyangiales bacterium]